MSLIYRYLLYIFLLCSICSASLASVAWRDALPANNVETTPIVSISAASAVYNYFTSTTFSNGSLNDTNEQIYHVAEKTPSGAKFVIKNSVNTSSNTYLASLALFNSCIAYISSGGTNPTLNLACADPTGQTETIETSDLPAGYDSYSLQLRSTLVVAILSTKVPNEDGTFTDKVATRFVILSKVNHEKFGLVPKFLNHRMFNYLIEFEIPSQLPSGPVFLHPPIQAVTSSATFDFDLVLTTVYATGGNIYTIGRHTTKFTPFIHPILDEASYCTQVAVIDSLFYIAPNDSNDLLTGPLDEIMWTLRLAAVCRSPYDNEPENIQWYLRVFDVAMQGAAAALAEKASTVVLAELPLYGDDSEWISGGINIHDSTMVVSGATTAVTFDAGTIFHFEEAWNMHLDYMSFDYFAAAEARGRIRDERIRIVQEKAAATRQQKMLASNLSSATRFTASTNGLEPEFAPTCMINLDNISQDSDGTSDYTNVAFTITNAAVIRSGAVALSVQAKYQDRRVLTGLTVVDTTYCEVISTPKFPSQHQLTEQPDYSTLHRDSVHNVSVFRDSHDFLTIGLDNSVRVWSTCNQIDSKPAYTTSTFSTITTDDAPPGDELIVETTCQACPAGQLCYGGRVVASCPPNISVLNPLLNICVPLAGYYLVPNSLVVEQCPEGAFCPGLTNIDAVESLETVPAPQNCVGTRFTAIDGENFTGYQFVTRRATQCAECTAGYACIGGGTRIRCVNLGRSFYYQPKPNQALCITCSDTDHISYIINRTNTACSYCPEGSFAQYGTCCACKSLLNTPSFDICVSDTDNHGKTMTVVGQCPIPEGHYRATSYKCVPCKEDEVCSNGGMEWRYTFTFNTDVPSGPISIALLTVIGIVCVVGLVLLVNRMVVARNKQHKPIHTLAVQDNVTI